MSTLLDEMIDENAELKARVKELEGDDIKPFIDMMRQDRDYLQAELDRATSKYDHAASYIRELQDVRDSLRAQLEAAKAQLTAQPDGVRASLWEQLAKCRGRIMDKQSADITCCFDQPDCEDHAEEKRLIQALAAPAPAPRQVTNSCWACLREKHGGPVTEHLHTCEKAPAPACKTCGDTKEVDHDAGAMSGIGYSTPCPDCAKGEL